MVKHLWSVWKEITSQNKSLGLDGNTLLDGQTTSIRSSTTKLHESHVFVIAAYGSVWVQDKIGRATKRHIRECSVFLQMFKGGGIKVICERPDDVELKCFHSCCSGLINGSDCCLRHGGAEMKIQSAASCREPITGSIFTTHVQRKTALVGKRSLAGNYTGIPALLCEPTACVVWARAPSSQDVFPLQTKQSVRQSENI